MTFKVDTVWTNVHLASMQSELAGLGEIKDAVVYAHDGVIVWVGPRDQAPDVDKQQVKIIDGEGGWLTPGLIDCHTHAVFAGDRAAEFKLRLEGASYQQIAEQGGGINSTVKATRAASFEQLLDLAKKHVSAMLANGVTTLEIKSGYGLDLATERKMLQVAAEIERQLPVRIKKTFLGAHALPPEYAGRADDYIDVVVNDMLPALHREGLVDAVDVFCENIGFTLAQTERVFAAAKALAIPVKIHAEQLSNLGGTELAAQYGALSSDHIEYLDAAGIQQMQQAGTVAVLLPGAFYFLRETQCPPIDALRKLGIPMALATDFNPGSSPIASLLLMLNMGCTLFKLTTDEAILGVTRHAAQALGLADVIGQIKAGFRADLALWSINQPAELCYQFGINKLQARFFSKN